METNMDQQTERILNYFEQINAIPRCSKNEARIGRWLKAWSDESGFESESDAAGNLVVRVPASAGRENRPTVVIQGHMDMVCEKTPASSHNFETDPIQNIVDGEWLKADQTTLGADNGIAIAYAMALATEKSVVHPPLELLFTVDEETGLNGVKALQPGAVQGKMLINLDSEDEGIFTIGCAGGEDTTISRELDPEPLPAGHMLYKIVVGGLRGGHSGIDIHKARGNANKIMGRVLDQIGRLGPFRLVRCKGGTRHNAIARDAHAVVACDEPTGAQIVQIAGRMEKIMQQELGSVDPGLSIKVEEGDEKETHGLSEQASRRVADMLLALPHGVAGMSQTLSGLVETSSNLASVEVAPNKIMIQTSQRSALQSRLEEMTASVHAIAQLAGGTVKDANQYPPWQPDMGSALLKQSQESYQQLFGKAPVIQVIHAGLECAIIGDRFPGMQMISFGPTIENPHSPTERLNIPSVEKVWRFLVALLAAL